MRIVSHDNIVCLKEFVENKAHFYLVQVLMWI